MPLDMELPRRLKDDMILVERCAADRGRGFYVGEGAAVPRGTLLLKEAPVAMLAFRARNRCDRWVISADNLSTILYQFAFKPMFSKQPAEDINCTDLTTYQLPS